jgi:hypothetical protein
MKNFSFAQYDSSRVKAAAQVAFSHYKSCFDKETEEYRVKMRKETTGIFRKRVTWTEEEIERSVTYNQCWNQSYGDMCRAWSLLTMANTNPDTVFLSKSDANFLAEFFFEKSSELVEPTSP